MLALSRSAGRTVLRLFLAVGLAACVPSSPPRAPATPATLATYAEASGWTELTPHHEVVAFYERLAAAAPEVRVAEVGRSREGRPLHQVVVARPPLTEPREAHASGKPIVFIGAQVHGDEPAGKEGLMLFARDLALGDLRGLLDDLVFVLVPQMNPDGAESGTWGSRSNAAGYNVNRDYLRLANPETRAIVATLVAWRPHVIVDAHELPGPPRVYDFYTLRPRNLNGPTAVSRFAAERAIPAIEAALAAHGYSHIVYHTSPALVDRPEEGFSVGGFGARSLTNYGGGLGAVTLLFESLRERDARIGIEDRSRRHRIAMEALATYMADHRRELTAVVAAGQREMAARGADWDPADSIAIRIRTVPNRTIEYRVMEMARTADGVRPTGEILELEVPVSDSAVVTLGRIRPVGYAIAASRPEVAAHLRAHGLTVERLHRPTQVPLETYRVEAVDTDDPYEGYIPRVVQVVTEQTTVDLPAGTFLVRATQPNAGLLFELMEPENHSSLAATGWLNTALFPGRTLPVYRLRAWPAAALDGRR